MERNNIIEQRTENFPSRKNCIENCPQHYHFVLFNPQSAGNHGSENWFFNFCEWKHVPRPSKLYNPTHNCLCQIARLIIYLLD